MKPARTITLVALLLAAGPAAAQQQVVFSVDPGASTLSGTLDAIGTDQTTFSVSGTIGANVTQAAPGTAIESFDPTGGLLRLSQGAPLSVTFGSGFGPGGDPHVALTLASPGIDAVMIGGARAATPTGGTSSSLPLAGLGLDLVSGGYEATGEIFAQAVAVDIDFAATPSQVEMTANDATLRVDTASHPDELTMRLPVELVVLVVPDPLYVRTRLSGELVLRAPLCGAAACPPACNDGLDNDGDGAIDFGIDPGCTSGGDVSERDASLLCDDGFDDDGDGLVDSGAGGDPVCLTPVFGRERSRCQDGIDNDGQPGTDFDGGESILGPGNGDPAGIDPDCVGKPERDAEATPPSCGVGFEIAMALSLLARRRAYGRRRRARFGPPDAICDISAPCDTASGSSSSTRIASS